MAIQNYLDMVEAEKAGQSFFATWRKQPTQTTGANIWFDLSMSPGLPVPNYYIGTPGVFTQLKQSADSGIPHGGNVAQIGKQKFLRLFEAQTATGTAVPLPLLLCDYQGFYPFIDESVTDEQFVDNTNLVTRYSAGLQVMPVVVAGHIGGGTFFIRYTNDLGVSGRQTPQHVLGTQIVNGTILTSGGAVANSRGPFMALQNGDTGVRSVDSVVFEGVGDIGLVSLALVKPIAKHYIRAVDAPAEQDYFKDASLLPEIKDDAYLNLIALPAGTLSAAPIYGYIRTVWI
jgi:hypothetical protein